MAVRGGYRTGSDLGKLAGLGVGAGVSVSIVRLDYAFVPYGFLGQAHRVSLGLKF